MDLELSGMVALVTGGSRVIGRALYGTHPRPGRLCCGDLRPWRGYTLEGRAIWVAQEPGAIVSGRSTRRLP